MRDTTICLGLFAVILWGCEASDSTDCSLESNQCADGFVCTQSMTGDFRCTPASNETDQGISEMSDAMVGRDGSSSVVDGFVDPSIPVYNQVECGSQQAEEIVAGTTIGEASEIAVGQLLKARIDPEAATNNQHFYRVSFEPGFYHFVTEERLTSGSWANIGLDLTWVDSDGNELEALASYNRIESIYRNSVFFEITEQQERFFRVDPGRYAEDYFLQFVPNGTPVASPVFEDCPVLEPLMLGQEYRLELTDEDNTRWFFIDNLPIGDYQYNGRISDVDGGNLIFKVGAADRFGEYPRWDEFVRVNNREAQAEFSGTHSVTEDSHFWIRVGQSRYPMNVTFTVTRQD